MSEKAAINDADNAKRWAVLQRKIQQQRAYDAFQLFRAEGIEPILIKGYAASIWYPSDQWRDSIDVDLAVSREAYSKALGITTSLTADGLAIDLHEELRHLDTRSWVDLFGKSVFLQTDDKPIRVLRPEDHLRVLCVHWLNDGGKSRDRLWDIYYLIANRAADFDWEAALNVVSPRRKRWLICTILLTHKHLGLDLAGTPVEAHIGTLPKWFEAAAESEWAERKVEIPLWLLVKRPREMVAQMLSRLNPNPIRSTVEMEGSFDARTRIFYKIGAFVKRILPSLRRNIDSVSK